MTEVVTFHFSGPPPDGFLGKALGFRDVLAEQPGFVEIALGVTHEEVDLEGKKGYVVVALVGWETKEDFIAFRDSETLKEKSPGVGVQEDVLVGREMRVANLQKLKA